MKTIVREPSPPRAVAPAEDALWRVAYAITGDRCRARDVVSEALDRLSSGTIGAARLYREVVALARASTRPGDGTRHAEPSPRSCHHDRLWQALRPLPRRQRAQIVQRLARLAP